MDAYLVLGISFNASPEEIKQAYREKVKQYHPDYNTQDPQAAERFNQVQEAYDLLNGQQPSRQAPSPVQDIRQGTFTTVVEGPTELIIEVRRKLADFCYLHQLESNLELSKAGFLKRTTKISIEVSGPMHYLNDIISWIKEETTRYNQMIGYHSQ